MQGRLGLKVIQGWPERTDCRGRILGRDRWASLDSRGSLEAEARMELMDLLAKMVFKEIQGHQVGMGTKELLGRWVKPGRLDQ